MIQATMAVAAVGSQRFGRAQQARQARFARLAALVLDTIFVGIISLVATNVFGVTVVTSASGSFTTSQMEIPAVWTTLIWLGYYTICEGLFSATPGKAVQRLRVVSVDDRPLTLLSILVRNFLRLVDVLPGMYLLGGVVLGLSTNSQRIGDHAAGTTVVFSEHAVEPGSIRTSSASAGRVLVGCLIAALVFTAGFDYFGRPALVIQSAFNEHMLGGPQDIDSYSLGQPTRTLDTVTYPIQERTPTQVCNGTITLFWNGFFGWEMSDGRVDCPPS